MSIQINEISEKYINKLGKSYFNTVKFTEATASIKMAVEETAEAAKKEIKEAIEPLKAKIAQKDEFIFSQNQKNRELQKENEELKQSAKQIKDKINAQTQTCEEYSMRNSELNQTVKTLQEKLDDYKPIIKEAYKQNITQEILEKKQGLASILSGLIHNREELKKSKVIEQPVKIAVEKPIDKPVVPITGEASKAALQKIQTKISAKTTVISEKIIQAIDAQRKNQKLDKKRIEDASIIIKTLLEDAPKKDTYTSVQEQFKKTMDKYIRAINNLVEGRYRFEEDRYGKIRIGTDSNGKIILKQRGTSINKEFHPYEYEIFNYNGSSMEIYDAHSDSYILFRDTNGKKHLKICYNDHYSVFISDKNGRLMVTEGIKDGVLKYLRADFNEVKPVIEIKNDAQMNAYADRLISNAKRGCKPQEKSYRDTTDIDYINPEGKRTVHEYYVNKEKNRVPIFTYLFNPKDDSVEKLISTGDFGIHGKIVDDGYGKPRIIQCSTKGITCIKKIRKNSDRKDFSMNFYKSTDNEHYEVQSLYDEKFKGDEDKFLQRPVYEKFNYGLASYPLTKSFTFFDLTKQQIKPWDFNILKPYL